jgi:hypothetical protein
MMTIAVYLIAAYPTREFDSGSWIGSCWSVKEQIATIDDLQDTIESYTETVSDREAAKALGDVADALGRLEVAIDAAGPNYRYDPVVKRRRPGPRSGSSGGRRGWRCAHLGTGPREPAPHGELVV